MNGKPVVSVVMPAYNSERFIEEAIMSVIGQTFEEWELLVVDDGSTDTTGDIVQALAKKDFRIQYLRNETNQGAARSRNRAIGIAKGRYIAFLDADDSWMPHKLEVQMAWMQRHALALTYGSYELMDEEGKTCGLFSAPQQVTYEEMLKTCSIGCLTVIYDTEKIGKRYMPEIKRRQDYALWLSILREIKETKGTISPIARYRIRKDSLSSNKLLAAMYQWRVYRETECLGVGKSAFYFIHYAVHGIRKYR